MTDKICPSSRSLSLNTQRLRVAQLICGKRHQSNYRDSRKPTFLWLKAQYARRRVRSRHLCLDTLHRSRSNERSEWTKSGAHTLALMRRQADSTSTFSACCAPRSSIRSQTWGSMCKRTLTNAPTHAACAIALSLRRATGTGMSRIDHANYLPMQSRLLSSQTTLPWKSIRNETGHGQGHSHSWHETLIFLNKPLAWLLKDS